MSETTKVLGLSRPGMGVGGVGGNRVFGSRTGFEYKRGEWRGVFGPPETEPETSFRPRGSYRTEETPSPGTYPSFRDRVDRATTVVHVPTLVRGSSGVPRTGVDPGLRPLYPKPPVTDPGPRLSFFPCPSGGPLPRSERHDSSDGTWRSRGGCGERGGGSDGRAPGLRWRARGRTRR